MTYLLKLFHICYLVIKLVLILHSHVITEQQTSYVIIGDLFSRYGQVSKYCLKLVLELLLDCSLKEDEHLQYNACLRSY